MDKISVKNFTDSYLYNLNTATNEKVLFNFIMNGEQIDPMSDSFADIAAEIKRRQVTPALYKVLTSPKTVMMCNPTPLPKAFKTFVAKDIKAHTNEYKLFIDADVVSKKNGVYSCTNIPILVAYLFSGMTAYIYHMNPKLLLFNTNVNKDGAKAFSALFTHIIDYLYKISSMGNAIKDKCIYLSAMYYLIGILKKDRTDSTLAICRNLSGLSTREEDILLLDIEDDEFLNIKLFVDLLSDKLHLPKLTLESVVEKWVWQYGTGTQYALELFPSFAAMMSNVYIGAYINQQKTIEKVAGRSIIDFTVALRDIGGDA